MLNNMKIKHLLFAAVGILLILLMIMGGASVMYSTTLAKQTVTLYDQPHSNLTDMLRAKNGILQASDALKTALLDKTKVDSSIEDAIESVPVLLQKISDNRLDKANPPSAAMQSLLKTAATWSQTCSTLLEAINNGNSGSSFEEFEKINAQMLTDLDSIIETASTNASSFRSKSVASAKHIIIIQIIMTAIALVTALAILRITLRAVSYPIRILLKASEEIAAGNLDANIDFHSKNEFGEVADTFRKMQGFLKEIIVDIDSVLDEMGRCNFSVRTQAQYTGNFQSISQSLEVICSELSRTISEINRSADQVSSGAEQISSGAQALAQGTTEQASSIERLAEMMRDMTEQIQHNAENAANANHKVLENAGQVAESNSRMKDMISAMEDIADKSGQIEKIIKTIEDIAFQTNILALNAAVEAARAGTAGKGFAVVADEVRNLANKSQEAAKNTAALIEGTISAVSNGNDIVSQTADSLHSVVEGTKEVSSLVNKISAASGEQATSAVEIHEGIDQISSVVQTNSATAEESAAASEELSSQAQVLKKLADRFQVRVEEPSLSLLQEGNNFSPSCEQNYRLG